MKRESEAEQCTKWKIFGEKLGETIDLSKHLGP